MVGVTDVLEGFSIMRGSSQTRHDSVCAALVDAIFKVSIEFDVWIIVGWLFLWDSDGDEKKSMGLGKKYDSLKHGFTRLCI